MSEIYEWNDLKNITKRTIVDNINPHIDITAMHYSDDEYEQLSLNESYAEELWVDFLIYIRQNIIKEGLVDNFMNKYSTNMFELANFEGYGDTMDSDYMTVIPNIGTFVIYTAEYGEVEIGLSQITLSLGNKQYDDVVLEVITNNTNHLFVNKLINAYDNKVIYSNENADGETLRVTIFADNNYTKNPLSTYDISDLIKWIEINVKRLNEYASKIITAYSNEILSIYNPEELKYIFQYFLDDENPYVELDFDDRDNIEFVQFIK